MEVTARSVGNQYIGKELDIVTQSVREGQGLAASLAARRVVPDVALKMIEVGESTGSLQDMLSSLADFYDEEVETAVSRFVTLIEPALLVVDGRRHRAAGAGAVHAALPAQLGREPVSRSV